MKILWFMVIYRFLLLMVLIIDLFQLTNRKYLQRILQIFTPALFLLGLILQSPALHKESEEVDLVVDILIKVLGGLVAVIFAGHVIESWWVKTPLLALYQMLQTIGISLTISARLEVPLQECLVKTSMMVYLICTFMCMACVLRFFETMTKHSQSNI